MGFPRIPGQVGKFEPLSQRYSPISLLISGKRNSELCEEKKDCLYQDSPPLI
ncbi:hypothetical protein [Desulfosediminicola ganghwensis]|uniref:hypothetical protein n=1 Tax=Desulfosediminicola ganghwensis TaxID=2569540 RepID=UPI00129464D6|nr:hypothetical protein [Desulfosediminicola ganghwensis]